MAAPLHLAKDRGITAPLLTDYLNEWAGGDERRQALAALIAGLGETSIPLAARLAAGCLPGDPAAVIGTNSSGDKQKALDMAAHDYFIAALRDFAVARVLSEEAEEVITLDPEGLFDVAIDPVDGSGSIGTGAPLGLLFCVFPAGESFLRPGREIIAAGYVSFGHSTDYGFSLGDGLDMATLDAASGAFRIDETGITLKPEASTIAYNASNQRRWSPGFSIISLISLPGRKGRGGGISTCAGWRRRLVICTGSSARGACFSIRKITGPAMSRAFSALPMKPFPLPGWLNRRGALRRTGGAIFSISSPPIFMTACR